MLIKRSILYLVIIIISLMIVFLYLVFNKKNIYYENELMVLDHNYVVTYILKSDLSYLNNHNKLLIDNKEYSYKIKDLELISGIETYYKVQMELKNDFLKNSFNNYKVIVRKENLLKYIIRLMKG